MKREPDPRMSICMYVVCDARIQGSRSTCRRMGRAPLQDDGVKPFRQCGLFDDGSTEIAASGGTSREGWIYFPLECSMQGIHCMVC